VLDASLCFVQCADRVCCDLCIVYVRIVLSLTHCAAFSSLFCKLAALVRRRASLFGKHLAMHVLYVPGLYSEHLHFHAHVSTYTGLI